MSGPRIVVEQPGQFRIVRCTDETGKDFHIVEIPDGCDAIGVERWKSFEMKNVKMFAVFLSYILEHCVKE